MIEAAKQHDFVIMRDVYRGQYNPKAMQSSMMYWSKPVDLYDKFAALQMYTAGGDQAYIEHFMRDKVTYWQDIADGIVSFKADVLPKGVDDAKVVIFHGKPRPWEQTRIPYEIGLKCELYPHEPVPHSHSGRWQYRRLSRYDGRAI
jgi:hypothetical protein